MSWRNIDNYHRKEKSVVSGVFGGGGSAKSAARAEERSAAAAVAEQRRQFDITREQAAPFREAGLSALDFQLQLLGLPPIGGAAPAAAQQQLGAAQPVAGGPFTLPEVTGRQTIGGVSLDPDPSRSLVDQLNAQRQQQAVAAQPTGVPGAQAPTGQTALQAFAETPGQQFLRQQQERGLLRSASAIGGLGGGNVRTALQQQAFGRAATQLGEFQNRLAAITGGGQVATQQIGQLGAQTAGQIGALLQAGGQARASGILGQQQARAGSLGGLVKAGIGIFGGGGLFGGEGIFG